jgi:CRP-like cAMP-binding protein
MTAKGLAAILRAGRGRTLGAGETLFRQGDPADQLFLVETGRLRLLRHLADGSVVVTHVASAGEMLAEAALFAEHYHCDAVADAEARVMGLARAELLARFRADPDLCIDFTRVLARQVQTLRWRLELRNVRPATERLLVWLKAASDGGVVRCDRPWKELAVELGLTHEALYRALGTLERRGVIRRDGGSVHLLGV